MQDQFNQQFPSPVSAQEMRDSEQEYRISQLEATRDQLVAQLKRRSFSLRAQVLWAAFGIGVLLFVLPYGAVMMGLTVPESIMAQTSNLALVFIGYLGGIISAVFGFNKDDMEQKHQDRPVPKDF